MQYQYTHVTVHMPAVAIKKSCFVVLIQGYSNVSLSVWNFYSLFVFFLRSCSRAFFLILLFTFFFHRQINDDNAPGMRNNQQRLWNLIIHPSANVYHKTLPSAVSQQFSSYFVYCLKANQFWCLGENVLMVILTWITHKMDDSVLLLESSSLKVPFFLLHNPFPTPLESTRKSFFLDFEGLIR